MATRARGPACRGRLLRPPASVQPHRAPHGAAAALEIALADSARGWWSPSSTGLKLVDGVKLAEILRANPRTQAARFIFLDDSATQGGKEGLGDVLLPSGAKPRRSPSRSSI